MSGLSDKAKEGNRRRNQRWKENNPEHVARLNREKSMRHYNANADAIRARMRERANARWKSLTPEQRRDKKLRENYGISLVDWEALFETQGRRCAACGSDDPGNQKGWMTDHCHTGGYVRGILCLHCNTGIGLARESVETLEMWARYIRTHTPE